MRRYLSGKVRPIPPKILLGMLIVLLVVVAGLVIYKIKNKPINVHDFDSCAAAGNPILETYPEQCTHQGQSYFRPGQAPPLPYR